jgi:hypothetical protein
MPVEMKVIVNSRVKEVGRKEKREWVLRVGIKGVVGMDYWVAKTYDKEPSVETIRMDLALCERAIEIFSRGFLSLVSKSLSSFNLPNIGSEDSIAEIMKGIASEKKEIARRSR